MSFQYSKDKVDIKFHDYLLDSAMDKVIKDIRLDDSLRLNFEGYPLLLNESKKEQKYALLEQKQEADRIEAEQLALANVIAKQERQPERSLRNTSRRAEERLVKVVEVELTAGEKRERRIQVLSLF